jgi:hypothetical protein
LIPALDTNIDRALNSFELNRSHEVSAPHYYQISSQEVGIEVMASSYNAAGLARIKFLNSFAQSHGD